MFAGCGGGTGGTRGTRGTKGSGEDVVVQPLAQGGALRATQRIQTQPFSHGTKHAVVAREAFDELFLVLLAPQRCVCGQVEGVEECGVEVGIARVFGVVGVGDDVKNGLGRGVKGWHSVGCFLV